MVLQKIARLAQKRKDEAVKEEEEQHKVNGFTPQQVFILKNRIHEATLHLSEEDWKVHFIALDKHKKGFLGFDDFRKAVRRANVKAATISDEDLHDIVQIVDADDSGQIDLEEFLGFLRPTHVPDIQCKASSWIGMEEEDEQVSSRRHPNNAVNGVGLSMTDDGCLVHTGVLDHNVWTSQFGVSSEETWIEFKFPKVYFISHMNLWNYMSTVRGTRETDVLRTNVGFQVSYSLNGRHWFPLGKVEGLPPITSVGIEKYFGECIQNKSAGGKKAMPDAHRKAALVEVDNLFGPPAKFLKFHDFTNQGKVDQFGLNGVYFYGPEAQGDCEMANQGLSTIPTDVYTYFQYVLRLDLSHNKLETLIPEMHKMVLLENLNVSYNYLESYPDVLNQGDFSVTLQRLNLSHNLLTSIPPEIANLKNLRILELAGHFWDPGALPEELGELKKLEQLDLSGLETVSDWLWLDEPRKRHGLPPSTKADHSVINEQEFLAFVSEHPLLLKTLGISGARAMFYRYDSNKTVTLDKTYVPQLDLHEAAAMDDMMLQIFAKPFCGLPDSVWELDLLTDIKLYRSGVEIYRYPGALPKLPATGVANVLSGVGKLGIFTMLEDQARSFQGSVHLDVPNITSVLALEHSERVLEERGLLDKKPKKAGGSITAEEEKRSNREERRTSGLDSNPRLPREIPPRYKDFSGNWKDTGKDAFARVRPAYSYL